MNYLLIIQARCGSSRLPGKVLMDIEGKPALQRVIERTQKARLVDEVVVATTSNKEDLPIVRLVSSLGVRVFVGNSSDVLDRYYQTAKLIRPKYVIRITADCPVIDYEIIDDVIHEMTPDIDYIAGLSETLADGLDVEVMKYEALYKAWKEAKLAHEREHVTMYIKNNKDLFHIKDYVCKYGDLKDQRWTLDEPEDYEMLSKIYKHFINSGKEDFLTLDILNYLSDHPEIGAINKMFVRNEGLRISLANDYIMKIEV